MSHFLFIIEHSLQTVYILIYRRLILLYKMSLSELNLNLIKIQEKQSR